MSSDQECIKNLRVNWKDRDYSQKEIEFGETIVYGIGTSPSSEYERRGYRER